jgi:hypothetical protein
VGRVYKFEVTDGKESIISEAPSVTTILGELIDKEWLHQWYAREAIKAVQAGEAPESAVFAGKRLSESAMESGSIVHTAIENFILTGKEPTDLSNEEINSWEEWKRWYSKHEVEWVKLSNGKPAIEVPVALFAISAGEDVVLNKMRVIYAGTLDAIAIVDGRYTILDWKTSSAIFDSYFPQLCLYKNALSDCKSIYKHGFKLIRHYEDEARECSYPTELTNSADLAVLRIPKDGTPFEYKVLKPSEQKAPTNFGLSLVEAWHWKANRQLLNKPSQTEVSEVIQNTKLY